MNTSAPFDDKFKEDILEVKIVEYGDLKRLRKLKALTKKEHIEILDFISSVQLNHPDYIPEKIKLTWALNTGQLVAMDLEPAPDYDENYNIRVRAPKTPAWGSQEGGGHYKNKPIQPMELSMANKYNPLQHTIVKYVDRYKDKNGKQDLLKARHCLDMLIDWEYGEEDQ